MAPGGVSVADPLAVPLCWSECPARLKTCALFCSPCRAGPEENSGKQSVTGLVSGPKLEGRAWNFHPTDFIAQLPMIIEKQNATVLYNSRTKCSKSVKCWWHRESVYKREF